MRSEADFAALSERYRHELRVHCYRMLGSPDDAEDLVQDTFLRAWRGRESLQGHSAFRAWLYRIATNACLDRLDRRSREPLPRGMTPGEAGSAPPPTSVPWLLPCPDRLLDAPETAAVDRETIELAFMVAIQHLPPRQRAVLILRDVLGRPAAETAALLEVSVASVNSALQRARPTVRRHLPARRQEWAPSSDPTAEERAVLRRYMAALEHADDTAVAVDSETKPGGRMKRPSQDILG